MAAPVRLPLKASEVALNGKMSLKLLRESHDAKREQERLRREIAFQRGSSGTRNRSKDGAAATSEKNEAIIQDSALRGQENTTRRSRPRARAMSAHSRRYMDLKPQESTIQQTTQDLGKGFLSPVMKFRSRIRTVSPFKPRIDQGSLDPEASSTTTTTGLTFYKSPGQKSNKQLIRNAVCDSCLPGFVHEDARMKALEALDISTSQHFVILFRDAMYCQFKAIYGYDFYLNCAKKVFGKGPSIISSNMTENFFKYDCGGKKFHLVPTTNHVSLQIDGLTIFPPFWRGKKA